ncbi:Asp-tRNA(Asn)/Glu-tRNA(Gln) amidotransferase subunit GatA [Candidatus Parcubacteria bacterium]|nr:Asp-tRNA(Asn)/Glu-tRNA(Gln) amidotransferase subunit GatA [Patescibacteria group bacterium]MBU4466746.1 Asp-tRNA(Asn)/Glu-tRNA(Gln) amidotransferase subunit GatA [Patescibacteria group bacterium]MCG2688695.1 Asp-tRNA(Asn)/Glu-tRNA(Gln) amidotransferase subunit GatA [Candidatus Parcubacteria bacterium]
MDLSGLTIKKAYQGLKEKSFSAKELVAANLMEIKKYDQKISAFLAVCQESALKEAKKADELISQGKNSFLTGIPYSAKDVFSTMGIETTASSNILKGYFPSYDATVIKKLKQAGAILIGKTNHDPFGFGSSTENSDFKITKNPWNKDKVPGGSSGGSAAAVASSMGIFSLAEDTGGSIRQPACFCGVTGLKVTYGRVSRFGVIAYGSSLDTIGVITKTVEDAAILLKEIGGKDENDATTLNQPVPDYLKTIDQDIKGLRIGIPKEYFTEGINKEIAEAINKAIKEFEALGAKIESVSLPYTEYAIPAYYLSGISEVSANLARYDGIRFGYSEKTAKDLNSLYLESRAKGFGPEVKRRIMLGTYALSAGYYDAFYKKAQQVRNLIKQDFDKVFEKVDMLIAPVSPFPAFNIGEKAQNPLEMWLADIFTVTINPAGIPGLAIPCGFTLDKLPIGLQLIGPQLSEPTLFRAGHAYQKTTDWHLQKPNLK